MTATNACVIGPSLHDWQYEKFSEQQILREEEMEVFKETRKADLMVDLRCQAYPSIDGVMEKVLERIFDDVEKNTAFDRLVFLVWANARRDTLALSQLLDQEMNAVLEKEFDAQPPPQGD